MKTTLLFFTVYSFNNHYAKKYGLDFLKKKGFNIVIVNVIKLIYPYTFEKINQYHKIDESLNIKQININSIKQIEDVLLNDTDKIFVFLLCGLEKNILAVLRHYKIDYILINNHIHYELTSIIFRIQKFIIGNNLSSIIKKITTKLLAIKKSEEIKPRFIMTRSDDISDLDESKTTLLYVNSFDYDSVIEQESDARPSYLPEEPYVVLLMNHPWSIRDNILNNIDKNSTIDKYVYKKIITRFIEMLEKVLGMDVIIAAHQKATEDENIYNGRLFVNDTAQMVKYAHGVVAHHSGAINFAVIHKKPICLIGLKCFPKYSEFSLANIYYSNELGVPLNYIDSEDDLCSLMKGEIFSINEKLYSVYMEKHILSKFNHNKRIWETVSSALEEKY